MTALHDVTKGAHVLVTEPQISNVHAHEAFRHHSWCAGWTGSSSCA